MADQDNLQFDRAEPAAGTDSGTRACAACTKPLTSTYFEVNGHVLCDSDTAGYLDTYGYLDGLSGKGPEHASGRQG